MSRTHTPFDRSIDEIAMITRKTAAVWATDNTVLRAGEMGIETDTQNYKIGDGSSTWGSLPYTTYPGVGEAVFTIAEKDKLAALPSASGDCFSLQGYCYLFDPSDATANVKYWGSMPSQPASTSPGYCKIYNPRQGQSWIRSVYLMVQTYTILGTAEATSMYLRVNDTTDYLISSQIKNDAALLTISATGLEIPLMGGDYFEFKWVIPQDVWATNPTGVRFSAAIWLDALGGPTGAAVSTLSASDVDTTIATLNGILTNLGTAASVDVSFEYGKTTAYGSTTTPEALTSPGAFDADLTSLDEDELYHFRAKAVGDETVYGSDYSFTTGVGGGGTGLYGTMAYGGVDPIGGGAGYTNIITQAMVVAMGATGHVITSTSDFLAHMVGGASPAASGDVVFIPAGINSGAGINLTTIVTDEATAVAVPAGVTLASDRGYSGSAGALIYHTSMTLRYIPCMKAGGSHVTLNGIRLRGPDHTPGTKDVAPFMTGFKLNYYPDTTQYHGLEVENCEIYDWPYAGLELMYDKAAASNGTVDWDKAAKVHHNYIHHCWRLGLGYGAVLGAASGYFRANILDACRHKISGSRDGSPTANPIDGNEVYVEGCYNIFGAEGNGAQYDQHAGGDTVDGWWGPFPDNAGDADCWAGGEIWLHHNDFLMSAETVLNIRGIPRFSWTFEYNWVKQGSYGLSTPPDLGGQASKIYQRIHEIPKPGGGWYSDINTPPFIVNPGEAITVANNWWSTATPPES